jgi:hypothetical protein
VKIVLSINKTEIVEKEVPGKLDQNLRRGHLAQQFGINLLCAFCAVAPVPQEEDVGLDAIGTILRRDGRNLFAEGSFGVQFKAKSVREIPYKQDQYDWLRRLNLPFFIGSVDIPAQAVALYATHHVLCRVDFEQYHSAVMYLDEYSRNTKDGELHQYLGPPILQWTHKDSESEDFQKQAYAVLKAWVSLEQAHYALRCIKTTDNVSWQINEVPELTSTMMIGHQDWLRRDIEAAIPYLMKIGLYFFKIRLNEEPPTPEEIAFMLFLRVLQEYITEESKFGFQILTSMYPHPHDDLVINIQVKNRD